MKNRILTLLILFIASGLITLITSCNSPSDNKRQPFRNDENLDRFFTTLYQKNMFNGAAAVIKNGKVIFKKGYGTANIEKNTPFHTSTSMEIASVSKQFTAAAIQLLHQQKKLDVNESAKKYLGEKFPYPAITIKHLLTHTSGLADYEDYFKVSWDTTRIAANDDILNYFFTETPKLLSEPGKKYKYSNSGYVLLAEIVRNTAGTPLDVFLNKHIFQIAEMNHTGFYDRDSIWTAHNYAPGYMFKIDSCKLVKPELLSGKYYYYFLSGRLGSGRLSSSIEDLIKWDSILYSSKIFNDNSKAMIFTPHPPTNDDSDYGFGWHIKEHESIGKIAYHTGSWAGNLSYIKRYLDKKNTVIILNNTHHSAYIKEIRKTVDNYVMGGTLEVPMLKLSELLKNQICDLNKDNIEPWYAKLTAIDKDTTNLRKLSDKYVKSGQKEKAYLATFLIDKLK